MQGRIKKPVSVLLAVLLVLFAGRMCVTVANADDAVDAVIAQLEAIDSLQTMQDMRKNSAYTTDYAWFGETDASVIASHEDARSRYNAYVAEMNAARLAAQNAYDALTPEQQAQIPAALVEKLTSVPETVYNFNISKTLHTTTDEYPFEAFFKNLYVYEMSMAVSPALDMPATIMLVDTDKYSGTWSPAGPYEFGTNNYELTYCCDAKYAVKDGEHYKRSNLEDAGYYSVGAAEHIRAIVQNAYPFISIDEMKAKLKAGGLNADFVDSLTRSDIIAGVQMAIWGYSNMNDEAERDLAMQYGGTIDQGLNSVFRLAHDYSNELSHWWRATGSRRPANKRAITTDAEEAYRVNTLVYYLTQLDGVQAEERQLVISNVEVTRAELQSGTNDTYELGVYVVLNGTVKPGDDVRINVTAANELGEVTGTTTFQADTRDKYPMTVTAKAGDTVTVTVSGTQNLERGVYLYEPQEGREVSQTLVGVAEGKTNIRASRQFTFNQDIEQGLRIYKTAAETGRPIGGISFDIYRIPENAAISDIPTQEEITQYAVAANLVDTVTTDETGYASLTLDIGRYMVLEQPNPELVEEPADPFYISVPFPVEKTDDETGVVTVEYTDIVSVYPKNTPVTPPPPPPPPPPPDNVTGQFSILKYDGNDQAEPKTNVLADAEFILYRPATADDTDTRILTVDGVDYAVVPVCDDGGEILTLVTDENGTVLSPALPCRSYFVVESKPPSGYYASDEIFRVTVVSSEITEISATLEVPNFPGNILPSTGGVGLVPFYAAGVALLLAAGALLWKKRRRSNAACI